MAFALRFEQIGGCYPLNMAGHGLKTRSCRPRLLRPYGFIQQAFAQSGAITGGGMRRLVPRSSETFNIFCCDPRTTNPNDYRLDLCVGTERVFEAGNEDIVSSIIPGGRCAVLRVVGHTDDLETAAFYLYRDWLPQSGEEARDFPLYCQRIAFFPEVAEHEAVADLFLPLR